MESEEFLSQIKGFEIATSGVNHFGKSDIRFWRFEEGRLRSSKEEITTAMKGRIRCLIQINDECLASSGADSVIKLWDLESGEQLKSFKGHKGCCSQLVHVNSNNILISGSEDRTIKIWDISSGKMKKSLEGVHKRWVGAIELINNNDLILAGDDDGKIVIWDIEKSRMIKKVAGCDVPYEQNGMISSIKVIDGNKYNSSNFFGTVSYDRFIKLWDLRTMKNTHKLNIKHGIRRFLVMPKEGENNNSTNNFICADAGGWTSFLSLVSFSGGKLRKVDQIILKSSAESLEILDHQKKTTEIALYGCDRGTVGMVSICGGDKLKVLKEFNKCHERDVYGVVLIQKNKGGDDKDLIERTHYMMESRHHQSWVDDDVFTIRIIGNLGTSDDAVLEFKLSRILIV